MPPSRIAFTLSDFIADLIRLQHRDAKPRIALRLDPVSFELMRRELSGRGSIQIKLGAEAREPYKFGGITVECDDDSSDGAASSG